MDGLLIIDKPAGPTSHDVVARMRRVLRERRIGHTGTLDPMATGVLPLVLGRATRLARFLSASDKSYEAVIRLGVSTDTADAAGSPIGSRFAGDLPSRDAIDRALDACRGTFEQQPPAYSAKKIDGKRSHRLARAASRAISGAGTASSTGAGAQPALASVTVHRLEIVSVEDDSVTVSLDCSAGFYVRSLAHDLGQRLGTGAHVASLRRTRSGNFTLDDAIDPGIAEHDPQRAAGAVIPLSKLLPEWLTVVLTPDGVVRAAHGLDLGPADAQNVTGFGIGDSGFVRTGASGFGSACESRSPSPDSRPRFVRLVDSAGELVGIAEPAATPGLLHPSIVLM